MEKAIDLLKQFVNLHETDFTHQSGDFNEIAIQAKEFLDSLKFSEIRPPIGCAALDEAHKDALVRENNIMNDDIHKDILKHTFNIYRRYGIKPTLIALNIKLEYGTHNFVLACNKRFEQ